MPPSVIPGYCKIVFPGEPVSLGQIWKNAFDVKELTTALNIIITGMNSWMKTITGIYFGTTPSPAGPVPVGPLPWSGLN